VEAIGCDIFSGNIMTYVCKVWGKSRKTCQDSRISGTHFNPWSPEHEGAVPIAMLRTGFLGNIYASSLNRSRAQCYLSR
jgi:hypothetical protein